MSEYSVPNNTEFLRMANRLKKMLPELEKSLKPIRPLLEGAKRNPELARNLTNVHQRVVHLADESALLKKREGQVRQQVKDIKEASKKAKEAADNAAKGIKTVKEKFEAFGKGLFKGKNNPTASQWGNIGGLLAITAFLTYKTFVDGEINDIHQANQDKLNNDLTKAYSNISRAVLLSRRNTHEIEKLKDQVNKNNAEITGQNRRITQAQKLGNDALYETRQQQKSFQQRVNEIFRGAQAEIQKAYKIANEALYETRQGRVKTDAQIVAQSTKINQQNASYNNQISQLKQQFQHLTSTVGKGANDSITSTIATIKQGVTEAKAEANKAKDYATTIAKTLELSKALTEAIKNSIKTVEEKVGNTQKTADTALKIGTELKTYVGNIQQAAVQQAKVEVAKVWEPRIYQAEVKVGVVAEGVVNVAKQVESVKTKITNDIGTIEKEITQQEKDLQKTKDDLKKIGADLNNSKKMDKEANDKLDKLVGGVAMIPPLIMNVGNSIKTQIPTIPQIENAAAVGTCRTTQPGGCSSKMMDDVAKNINANTNDKFGQLNAALNGADLALLGVINNKLGNQVEGGLSGMLKRITSNAVIDRLLNLMIFSATLHNAWMLSNNLGQTLMSIVDNVLGFFGIKDGEGQNVSIGLLIGSSVENFVKSIIGTENYIKLTEDLAKANRIYQATTNIINSFQNLSSVILNALEVTVGRIGKIGNALRQAGEVLENAYTWMNPQPKFNRITQTLESLNQGASTIQMVTQIPLDIAQATTDLTNSATELTKALKEDNKPENKGTSDSEPETLKAERIASKAVSVGKDMTEQTLEPDEDEEIV